MKLTRPQADKMSEHLDDMVGGVGDVRDSGEMSAEEDVEDETRVEEARDALRRRTASRPTVEEIRRHWATHLPFPDWCPECVAGSANDWPHRHRGIEADDLSVPSCSVTTVFQRTTLAETTLLCWWLEIAKPG